MFYPKIAQEDIKDDSYYIYSMVDSGVRVKYPGIFLHSRVTGAYPVATDFINVRTTTTTTTKTTTTTTTTTLVWR